MQRQALLESYQQNGYLHLKSFFDPKKVLELRETAREIFKIRLGSSKSDRPDAELFDLFASDMAGFIGAGRLCQHLPGLHSLSLEPQVLETLNVLKVQLPTICTRPVMFFNHRDLAESEGYWKTPAHQDWRSMQGSLNSVVLWMPLMDMSPEVGPLEVAPGSHRLGLLETQQDDWYRAINPSQLAELQFKPLMAEAGDAIFFSSFLVHRSGNNTSSRVRWSCHFRYNDAREKAFVERRFPNPYSYKPQQDLITPDFPSQEEVRKIFQ